MDSVNLFDILYNKYYVNRERPPFRKCSCDTHQYNGSVYQKEFVPLDKFINPYNNSYYKICLECRQYINQNRNNRKHKKDVVVSDLYKCNGCRNLRTKDFCDTCSLKSLEVAKTKIEIHRLVIWERIVEVGCCCELCKRIFIKKPDGAEGFLIGNNINTITQFDIEYRNLEWDHLTEKEQLQHFGCFYGLKTKGVSEIYAYESKKAESRKCMLVCLYCHVLKTIERRDERVRPLASREQEKLVYINNKKLEVGVCQICGIGVDVTNLSYFEMDHVDPTTKLHAISDILGTSAMFTMDCLINELNKCRLVCKYCHRIHTGDQTKTRYANMREKKREKYFDAVNKNQQI